MNKHTLFLTISVCVGLSMLSEHIEHTLKKTAIIPKTGIILVTITGVRLNFPNVTSLIDYRWLTG